MLRRLPILASCILLCLGCDTAAKQQKAEDARRATSSRSEAPASEQRTRASVRALRVETVARGKFARTEFRRFAVALPLAQVGYHPRSTNAAKNPRAP